MHSTQATRAAIAPEQFNTRGGRWAGPRGGPVALAPAADD